MGGSERADTGGARYKLIACRTRYSLVRFPKACSSTTSAGTARASTQHISSRSPAERISYVARVFLGVRLGRPIASAATPSMLQIRIAARAGSVTVARALVTLRVSATGARRSRGLRPDDLDSANGRRATPC